MLLHQAWTVSLCELILLCQMNFNVLPNLFTVRLSVTILRLGGGWKRHWHLFYLGFFIVKIITDGNNVLESVCCEVWLDRYCRCRKRCLPATSRFWAKMLSLRRSACTSNLSKADTMVRPQESHSLLVPPLNRYFSNRTLFWYYPTFQKLLDEQKGWGGSPSFNKYF